MYTNFQINIKKGVGNIVFGCTTEIIRAALGDPEDIEVLENAVDGHVESIVWNYPEAGLNFFFDAEHGEPALVTIESDNLETVLFNSKIFNITKGDLIALMQENGYKDLDEDDETWGEHRVTFDDAQIDFYYDEQELTLVSWSSI